MPDERTTRILDTALWRFALQGVPATKTAEIATLAGVGVGTLFRTFPTKETLLQATYEHAIEQLTAPLQAAESEPRRGAYLHPHLERWWQLSAQAALAFPHAFDLWRLVRTMPRPAAPALPLLGPVATLSGLVEEALQASPWHAEKGLPLSVLLASLAAQWTGAVDLVLSNDACRAESALRTRVLAQAYAGWWQSTGLSTSLQLAWQAAPARPRPKPKTEIPLWAQLLQAAVTPAPPPAPAGPVAPPHGLKLNRPSGPPAKDELPQK